MLKNAPMTAGERCGYTRQSIRGNESKRERFDPSRGKTAWTLLSVNGRPPSAKVLRNYAENAEDRIDRQHPLAFDLESRVQSDSWSLVSETDDEAVFSFRLSLDEDEDIDMRLLDKINSTLTLDKRTAQPKRVLIESTGPASLAPLVVIRAYRQEYLFDWNDAVGAAALKEKITHRRGSAAGIRSLDKDKRVLYSDYECAVYAQELPREMPLEN
jgi:hypothetical protein